MLRFAPSPSGLLHVGNLRVALLNYLFARKYNKKFFLRIDDTDLERSSQKYTESIISDLKWLNIEYFDIFKQKTNKNHLASAPLAHSNNNLK